MVNFNFSLNTKQLNILEGIAYRLNHYESDEIYPSKESLIKDTILNLCCLVENVEG